MIEDLEGLVRLSQEVAAQARRESRECQESRRKKLAELAGEHWEDVLRSQEEAMRCLEHPDWQVRLAAIGLLYDPWRQEEAPAELPSVLEKIAFTDAHSQVRCGAVDALAGCFSRTDDVRVGRILAGLVRDEAEPIEVRLSAYIGLHVLRGQPVPPWPGLQANPPTTLRIPEDVDWDFVDSFLVEPRSPSPVDLRTASVANLPEPDRTQYLSVFRGKDAFERGDYAEAISYLTAGVQYELFAHFTYYARGRCYLELGRVDEAIADFAAAIEREPRAAKAYDARAEAYRRKGLFQLAEEDDRTAAFLRAQKQSQ